MLGMFFSKKYGNVVHAFVSDVLKPFVICPLYARITIGFYQAQSNQRERQNSGCVPVTARQ